MRIAVLRVTCWVTHDPVRRNNRERLRVFVRFRSSPGHHLIESIKYQVLISLITDLSGTGLWYRFCHHQVCPARCCERYSATCSAFLAAHSR